MRDKASTLAVGSRVSVIDYGRKRTGTVVRMTPGASVVWVDMDSAPKGWRWFHLVSVTLIQGDTDNV